MLHCQKQGGLYRKLMNRDLDLNNFLYLTWIYTFTEEAILNYII
jgi:hypothetical protein